MSECQLLDGLLDRMRAGETVSAVLRGGAGVGKSALLDYVSDSASDCNLIRVSGNMSEAFIPYAGLHQLCTHIPYRTNSLSEAQAEALAVAFGLRGGDPDPLTMGAALIAVLLDHSCVLPLVCVVDNAECLDQASARSLAFLARHSPPAHLAVFFATRQVDGDELSGLPELTVDGLREEEARSLLVRMMNSPLDNAVIQRVLSETNGNPSHLVTTACSVHPVDLAGGFGFDAPLPDGIRAEHQLVRRLMALPEDTLELLLTAALEPTGDAATVWRAASRAGIGPAAAVEAVSEGIVEFGTRIRFPDYLTRSALYQLSSLGDVQRIHGALAEETDPVRDPARRAWHRAHSTTGPDESIAEELIRHAGDACHRGGLSAEAAFLERAAALTVDPSRRVDRILDAALAKHRAGSPPAASHLLDLALRGPLDRVRRARARYLRGSIAMAVGRPTEAIQAFLNAARQSESEDPKLVRDSYLGAVSAVVLAGPRTREIDVVDVARAVLSSSATPNSGDGGDLLLVGVATTLTRGLDEGAPVLQRAIQLEGIEEGSSKGATDRLSLASHCARNLWDDESWERISGSLVATARRVGALTALPKALDERTILHLYRGDLESAAQLVDEADRVTDATDSLIPRYGHLLLDAWRGRESTGSDLIESSVKEAESFEDGSGLGLIHVGAAVLYNGLGRYDLALRAAEQAVMQSSPLGYSDLALPELVEAATRYGQTHLAIPALSRLTAIAGLAKTDWARGVEARSRALVSFGNTADRLYAESIEHLDHSHLRMDLTRAHLLYGEWLRRAGRRIDARGHLRIALAHFDDMGCEAFAERTRRELVATGEKVRKRSVETRNDLTAQELQIARLACSGRTNPEIGAELFISPRTVEWHLRKVYPKLGITSRRDLRLVDIH